MWECEMGGKQTAEEQAEQKEIAKEILEECKRKGMTNREVRTLVSQMCDLVAYQHKAAAMARWDLEPFE